MGLFSNKILVAEMNVALSKDNAFVFMRNVPYDKDGKQEVFFDEEVFQAILYLYYFDRVVGNLSENTAGGAIKGMQIVTSNVINETMNIKSEEWNKKREFIKTPNIWHFCNKEEDLKDKIFSANAKIYLDGDRIYCNTEFPFVKFIDAYAYLSVEALFSFLIQNLDYFNFSFYFLSAFLAQLSYYEGKRPSVFNLGKAVMYGLEQANELRQKHFDIK